MSTRPRILSIIPYKILPARLGGEKGIAVFNEYLSKETELAGVTTRNNDPALATYKLYNIISNHRIRYLNIFLYFSIRKLLKKERSGYFLTEHPYYGWLGWMIKKTTNVKWLVHSHNMEYMRSKSIGRWWWKALKWYESWVYRKADKTFFISEDDMDHAIHHLNADAGRSMTVTFGIEQSAVPDDLKAARKNICRIHGISEDKKILLFNGALYHATNYDALKVILDQINPYLLEADQFGYVIVVCGKGLPDFFNNLKEYANRNVVYAGFVDDINSYFKAADVFLNPILSGGGVKTKAIEAISMNCSVVSTPLGALGLKKEVCGRKLQVLNEGNWQQFAATTIELSKMNDRTPEEFYDYYSWINIINRVVRSLNHDAA